MLRPSRSHLCLVTVALAIVSSCALAEPSVQRGPDAVTVDLANGAVLEFALDGDLLLGLRRATVDGIQLTSGETVQRPVLAQEFGDGRVIWPAMRFKEALVAEGSVEIHCTLLATDAEKAFRDVFVFGADREKALAGGITPQLRQLLQKRDAALAAFETALAEVADVKDAAAKLQEVLDQQAAAPDSRKGTFDKQIQRARKALDELKVSLRPTLAQRTPALAAALKDLEAFEEALAVRGLEVGDIHRDFYRFAHLRQPEDICRVETLRKQLAALQGSLKPAGTLIWVLKPDQRNIAGWTWTGWKQHVRFELADGRKINAIRQLGTWELGGGLEGLTVSNLRYRGLGRIENAFETDAEGRTKLPFSTTEIIPGAVGGAYAVSPVVPSSDTRSFSDRGYALRHRVGAWICRMARSAGHGFVDFQFRPGAAFTSFYEKQGNLRALTEAFPGDRLLSQTDEELFALTDRHTTQDQVYLVLKTADAPRTVYESRTRWQEVDQYVRDIVSAELGFVQYEPLPGIGLLTDGGWAGYIKGMAASGVDNWAKAGVKLIAYHNPGWVNGRYQGPKNDPKTPAKVGGGVCSIYDWWPTRDVEQPWKDFTKACAAKGIAYYPWLGMTIVRDSPFYQRVGDDLKHWSLNAPGDTCGPGYEPLHVKGNLFDETFRTEYLGQLDRLRTEMGYNGFWVDSFQNLFMSQLDWANGTGNSMQRAWWEQIALWSRGNIAWMGESHSFPGMSCSIEVADWEKDFWYFQHVWKWHRGPSQANYKPAELDSLLFRVMACKGWTAPDHSNKTDANFAIPSFTRMANEYSAALETMRRSYVLPGGKGMLWLSFAGDGEGVVFAFEAMESPDGVAASSILDGKAASSLRAEHTYRVKGSDLLKAFGVRRGPNADPRIGRTYKMPTYTYPDWGTE